MLTSLSGSTYQGVLTQYYDTDGRISGNVAVSSWTDQSIAAPSNVNWNTMDNEILYSMAQQSWPGSGINNLYLIFPAPGSGYSANFVLGCASHYYSGTIGAPQAYVGWPGDPTFSGCDTYDPLQQGRDWAAASVAASHEYAEAVTDTITKKYAGNFTGWNTGDATEDEIADKCIGGYPHGGVVNGINLTYLWSNDQGGCSLSHPIVTNPPPALPSVQTTTPTAIQEEQATLNGTVNPNGSETTYRFEYGKTTSYGKSIPMPNAGAGAGTSAVPVYLTPTLQPRTRYHFRLVASNAGGTSYGSDQAFTTGMRWYLRNSNSAGNQDAAFWFGLPNEKRVSGDWNGDGTTTIGTYDPVSGNWKLRNSNTTGKSEISFQFGGGPWTTPVSGDWDGNGTTTIGLYDPTTGKWRLKNSTAPATPTSKSNTAAPSSRL